MNFFESQDKARKKTFWLVLYFIVAIILIILAIDLIVAGALIYIEPEKYINGPITFTQQDLSSLKFADIKSLLIGITVSVSPLVVLVILLGTLWKIHRLKGGGIAVANMVGAKPISPSTKDFLEKRFINVVEEMSIASGVLIPKLYVMEDQAINAFVAGFKPEDTVMVVTRGALMQLSRDELQSVVGHEFSHIFNSDMQISLKIMGVLGGLLLIGQIGYFLLRMLGRSNSRSSSSSSSNSKSGGNVLIFVLIIGVGLLILGYIGLFFGRLIKAAVSRQRELLADSSSVQFTRNPQGLVFALRRILQSEKGTYLASKNVEDISHLCFCTPRWIMFQSLLATHPPLDKRIDLLDPQGQYKNLPLGDLNKDKDNESSKKSQQKESLIPLAVIAATAVLASNNAKINPTEVKNSIGNPTPEKVNLAAQLLAQIPANLQEVAHDPNKVGLLYYAFVLAYHEEKIDKIKEILSKYLNNDELEEVVSLSQQIHSLPKPSHLPLFDISLPSFKSNAQNIKEQIYNNLLALSEVDEKRLFQFTLLTILERATYVKLPGQTKPKYTDFAPVITEISQLISAVLKVGAKDKQTEDEDFTRLMKNFTSESIARPQFNNAQPIKFQEVLATLNLLTPLCKEKLIQVLLECIAQDNEINLSEAELIRAIAASLDCPIPPIVATA